MTADVEVQEAPGFIEVGDWELKDWLSVSLAANEITAVEMAEYLGVSRSTITNWTTGKIRPSVATLRAWAVRTGIPYHVLAAGKATIYVKQPIPPDVVRRQGLEPRTRWLRASRRNRRRHAIGCDYSTLGQVAA